MISSIEQFIMARRHWTSRKKFIVPVNQSAKVGNYFKIEKILKTVFFSGNTANCRDSYTVKIELPQGQINDHYFIDTMNIVIKYQRPRSRGHFELLVSISDNKRSSHDGFTKSGSVSFIFESIKY